MNQVFDYNEESLLQVDEWESKDGECGVVLLLRWLRSNWSNGG